MPQLFARPRTPNDNPFIESMFSTVKTDPEFPDRFQDDVHAEAYFGVYVPWYNNEHYHSGIDYVTPQQAHTGQRAAIVEERQLLDPIRNVADTLIDTSNYNVHELRTNIQDRFGHGEETKRLLVSCLSFGFKNGVPLDADMVFDVRFLPNPFFVPEFRKKTGLDRKVVKYISGFPQATEFLDRATKLMLYLLPHYVEEGKSYLTVAFGCTGGQHRSVMMAEELSKRLKKAGYHVKALHRDMP